MTDDQKPIRDPEPVVERLEPAEAESESVEAKPMIPSDEYEDPGIDPDCVNSPLHAYHEGQPCP